MRTRTALFFAMAAFAASVVGCSSDETVDNTPAPGAGGAAGAGGITGAGGVIAGGAAGAVAGGAAGAVAGGAAGAVAGGAAGAVVGGAAGAGGADGGPEAAAGAGGVAGAGGDTTGAGGAPPPVDLCAGKTPQRPLPYKVATDFIYPNNITPIAQIAVRRWIALANPDCDMAFSDSSLPPIPPEFTAAAPEAGTDDGGTSDAADIEASAEDAEASTDDAAADVSVGDASADVSLVTDGAPGDAPAEAAAPPACWGFYYNPDNCAQYVADVTDAGGVAPPLWQCWGGAIYETSTGTTDPATLPGICIAAGATNIEFWARASRDGASVKFGSTRSGSTTEEYLTIDTTWKKYSISVSPDYRNNSSSQYGVFNGFSVVVEPGANVGGTYIFVKDMTWVNAATD